MGGVREEHLTIDLQRSATDPGGVTRSRFHRCPYTAKRGGRNRPSPSDPWPPALASREHGIWFAWPTRSGGAAYKLERAAPAGGAKRETARTLGPVTRT
jgi:hypothetical protein